MRQNNRFEKKFDRMEKLKNFHHFLLNLNMFKDIAKEESKHALSDALETDQLLSILNFKRKSEIVEAVPLRFTSIDHYTKLWEQLFF